jgi:signal transduction histidine kinase
MAINPLEEKLSRIKGSLHQLGSQPMTNESRLALQNILKDLDGLAQDLQISHEQSRLAALYSVSQALGSSLDLDKVLNQVMDAVIGLTHAERGFLVLLEENTTEEWRLRAARNYGQETLQPKDMEVSSTVIGSVIQSGQGLLTTDARNDPRFSEQNSVVFYALRSIMCAPLLSRGKAIGAIYVDNRAQTGLFSPGDLELLNAFASQAAVALENAWLYTRTDQALAQRVAELETLAQVDRELNKRLDFDLALEITRNWVMQVSKAAQVWVLLIQEDLQNGAFISFPPGFSETADPLIENALEELKYQLAPATNGLHSRLVVPILHSSKPLGVIVVDRVEPFSQLDAQFLSHLCGRAAAAIENARLYQAVQSANQAKTKFISVVTHELRIPMTSIKGYTDLIRQGAVGTINEQQLSFLNVVRNNVDRMSALVSDLSEISRIETGRLKLECSLIQVQEYVEEVVRSLQPKLEEKHQFLDAEFQPDLSHVFADPNRLMQILTNLVSNACKYTPVNGKIHIQAYRQDQAVRIDVVDTGIGISAEDQTRLFSQFFRSEDPVVREEQGWGLGLSVTKLIVELMGGCIGFTSVYGKGSTFWFTLPTRSAEEI